MPLHSHDTSWCSSKHFWVVLIAFHQSDFSSRAYQCHGNDAGTLKLWRFQIHGSSAVVASRAHFRGDEDSARPNHRDGRLADQLATHHPANLKGKLYSL